MSIDFNQLNSNVSDSIRRIIHGELSGIVDRICERVEKNLDLESEIDLDEVVEETIENMCTTVTCRTCNNDLDVDSVSASASDLEVVVDDCRECASEYINEQIQNNWSIMIKSRVDIDYDIDEVHVGDESIVITVNDHELAQDLPDEVFVIKIASFYVQRFFRDPMGCNIWLDTDPARALIASIAAVDGVEPTPQIITLRKEI